jgi:hypothetical protein
LLGLLGVLSVTTEMLPRWSECRYVRVLERVGWFRSACGGDSCACGIDSGAIPRFCELCDSHINSMYKYYLQASLAYMSLVIHRQQPAGYTRCATSTS